MPEELLYEGKAKKVFATDEDGVLVHRYKDDATAFNAQKRGSWKDKGRTNATMSAAIFAYLEANGVPTHFVEQVDESAIKTHRLDMLPIEVIVRNVAAGSLSKRLGYEEGAKLRAPDRRAVLQGRRARRPDAQLVPLQGARRLGRGPRVLRGAGTQGQRDPHAFLRGEGVTLVDFKIEVGRDADGKLMLADEISPDTCRFWDKETGEKLDKDRFRRDMGGVEEAYAEMLRRGQGVR